MNMNWYSVASNALWMLALALALALVGIAYWESIEKKVSLRLIFSRPKMQGVINLTLTLFCLGLGFSISPIWAKVLWFILALFSLVAAWYFFRLETQEK